LASGTATVLVKGKDGTAEQAVALTDPAQMVVREDIDEQEQKVWVISLEVVMSDDAKVMQISERRQVRIPEELDAEVTPSTKAAKASSPPVTLPDDLDDPDMILPLGVEKTTEAIPEVKLEKEPQVPLTVGDDFSKNIVVIASGEKPPASAEQKGYIRKTDILRAQFLPEIEALDLSGLFVCEFGTIIRQEQERRNVVLTDAARITEVLLQGNGYRRSGNHSKALTCYQELVDMDANNADFRFLLAKTLLMLGREDEAIEAFMRAKELGHEGAKKELDELKAAGVRAKKPLGFLRFWKQ